MKKLQALIEGILNDYYNNIRDYMNDPYLRGRLELAKMIYEMFFATGS